MDISCLALVHDIGIFWVGMLKHARHLCEGTFECNVFGIQRVADLS